MPDPISSAFPASAAIQGGLGLVQSVVGLINSGAAKKQAAELERTRPQYAIKDGIKNNLSLAQSELANGMSARAESAYNQAADRQMGTSIDAILRGGGSVNNVADVFDSSDQGRLRLAQMQDSLRLNQIQNLVHANTEMANAEDTAFLTNQLGSWKDKAQANAQARQGAQNQIFGGLGTAAQGAMNGFQQQRDANAYNNYFNPAGQGGQGQGQTMLASRNTYLPPSYLNRNPTRIYPPTVTGVLDQPMFGPQQ